MNNLVILLILVLVFILAGIGVGIYFLVFHKRQKNNDIKYQWETKNDAPCSQPCGGGVRYKTVLCETKDGKIVDPKYCDVSKKPPDVEQCNTQDCKWSYSKWSPDCPACGKAKQTRTATCEYKDNCPQENKEALERDCDIDYCQWKVKKETECDKPCNGGTMTQYPECPQGEGQCDPSKKPPFNVSCNEDPCNWVSTDNYFNIFGTWKGVTEGVDRTYTIKDIKGDVIEFIVGATSESIKTTLEELMKGKVYTLDSSKIYSGRKWTFKFGGIMGNDSFMADEMVGDYNAKYQLNRVKN